MISELQAFLDQSTQAKDRKGHHYSLKAIIQQVYNFISGKQVTLVSSSADMDKEIIEDDQDSEHMIMSSSKDLNNDEEVNSLGWGKQLSRFGP